MLVRAFMPYYMRDVATGNPIEREKKRQRRIIFYFIDKRCGENVIIFIRISLPRHFSYIK